MSSWAEGNFEDDDALDYVYTLTHRIVLDLDRAAGKRRLTGDDVLTRCMPRLAVLALLVHGVPTTAGLNLEQLRRWRTAFLAGFDREAAAIYDDPTDAQRRRKVIEQTFRKLERSVPAAA